MFFWDYPEISVSGFARIDGQNNVSALITNAPNNGRELWQVKPDSVVLVSETALDNLGSNAAGLIPLYVYPGQQGNYGSMFWTHVYQNNNTYNCDFRQPNSRNVGSVRSMCAKGFILDDAAFDQLNSLQTKTSLSIQITTDGVTIYLPNSGDGIHVGAKGNGPVSITGIRPPNQLGTISIVKVDVPEDIVQQLSEIRPDNIPEKIRSILIDGHVFWAIQYVVRATWRV
jgi:hypothetical protein